MNPITAQQTNLEERAFIAFAKQINVLSKEHPPDTVSDIVKREVIYIGFSDGFLQLPRRTLEEPLNFPGFRRTLYNSWHLYGQIYRSRMH